MNFSRFKRAILTSKADLTDVDRIIRIIYNRGTVTPVDRARLGRLVRELKKEVALIDREIGLMGDKVGRGYI